MDSLFVWFLITVLPSGQPGDAKGFPTKGMCEYAKHAAMYEMSAKEKANYEAEETKARIQSCKEDKRKRKSVLDNSPERKPRTKTEISRSKNAVSECKKGGKGSGYWLSDNHRANYQEYYTCNGTLKEVPFSRGHSYPYPDDCSEMKTSVISKLAFAECVRKD